MDILSLPSQWNISNPLTQRQRVAFLLIIRNYIPELPLDHTPGSPRSADTMDKKNYTCCHSAIKHPLEINAKLPRLLKGRSLEAMNGIILSMSFPGYNYGEIQTIKSY